MISVNQAPLAPVPEVQEAPQDPAQVCTDCKKLMTDLAKELTENATVVSGWGAGCGCWGGLKLREGGWVPFLSTVSGHVRMVSANQKKRVTSSLIGWDHTHMTWDVK